MAEDPPDEHVVILPDGEELRLSYDPLDGQQEQETLIEVDPVIREFLRSPYDPVIGAAAYGRIVGEVARNPPRTGWMLPLTIAVAMIFVGPIVWAVGWELYGSDPTLDLLLNPALLISLPFAVAGLLMLWRLLRR